MVDRIPSVDENWRFPAEIQTALQETYPTRGEVDATFATNEEVQTYAYGTDLDATDLTVSTWVGDTTTESGKAWDARYARVTPPATGGDDTVRVNSALDSAIAEGNSLKWLSDAYQVTGNLPNLHKVRHEGDGSIVRDGITFWLNPQGSETNVLHVSPAGSDANDGLTPALPFATFQAAFDAVANYGPVLDGVWEVAAAAGVYPSPTHAEFNTRSVNRVIIRGPAAGHPNVPTAILDGAGGAAYAHGLRATTIGVRVEFRDLKFINFTAGGGDTTRIGCVGEQEADVLFTNIHADGASWCGTYAFNTVRARMNGGIFDGCRSGFIANDTDATVTGTIARNSTQSGIYWSRGSQGHIDYAVLEDNAVGVDVGENSRVHTVGVDYKRNSYGVRTKTGGVYSDPGNTSTFNAGTADAQLVADLDYRAMSGETSELEEATGYFRLAHDAVTRNVTGTTAKTTLSVPYTIPAGRLVGPGKQVRVHVLGIFDSLSNGTKMHIEFGGMRLPFTANVGGSFVPFEVDVTLVSLDGGTWRAIGCMSWGQSVRFGQDSSGFDPNVDQPITIATTPIATTEAINVYRTDVYVMG